MGTLRFILALSVVLNHLEGIFRYQMAGGSVSVQLFFMVSGFFMAMILSEKYDPRRDLLLFWTNRGLRIYVTFYAVALIAMGLSAAAWVLDGSGVLHEWMRRWPSLSPGTVLVLLGTQLSVLGQDVLLFLRHNADGLSFASHGTPDYQLIHLLLIPPAWSVSLELLFYMLVPFMVRLSTPWLVAVVLMSLAARALAGLAGFTEDPWSYRFFPFELALFGAGMLAYRCRSLWVGGGHALVMRRLALGFVLLVMCMQPITALARWSGVGAILPLVLLYVAAIPALPALFMLSRRSKIDHFLADFSYPLYLVHYPVLSFVDVLLKPVPDTVVWARPLLTIGVSLLLSMAIIRLIEKPVDAYRQRKVARAHAAMGS
jgi:peptidoglycan/LPS O-acetylase OafA/YrhL